MLSLGLATCLAAVSWWLWTPDRDLGWLRRQYLLNAGDLIAIAGTTLHVRDSGPRDAPPVILVHGFGSSLQTWDSWAAALEADHRVIRLDLPGSGLSLPDSSGSYTDRRSVELLLALQDHLQLRSVSIIGHSIGGRIAWTFAAQHPERVKKLVLVAPDGFASPGFAYHEAPKIPSVLKLMRYVLPKPLLRLNLAPAYADPAKLTDDLTSRYRDLLLAPGAREAMLMRMQQTVLVDPVPLLAKIRAPTLLVWGEQDAMIPIANSADYLKSIKDARLFSVAEAGHLPHEETPERAIGAVRAFLDEP
ncbi:MAG: alpha/beta fold hydrolase [Variovorax sp.]|nr:MAG: alpha/beta fold hydrolase [Variovorax sp.]